jgi:membrane protein YdbS with pleckstrin-like domain
MKCSICNAESAADATFCAKCGAKLAPGGSKPASPAESGASGSPAGGGALGRGRNADVPEEVLWEGTYSPKAMLGATVGAALVSVALAVVAVGFVDSGALRLAIGGAIVLVWLALGVLLLARRLGIRYKLTNQMFYHQEGILTRTTDRIELIEVHDVTWKQGLVQRLVNVGTVIITSSDRTNPKFEMDGVEDVEEVAKKIDNARRGEQVRRGRRIESIGVADGG